MKETRNGYPRDPSPSDRSEETDPDGAPWFCEAPLPDEPPIPGDAKRLRLAALVPSSCRWPIGDPSNEDFRFCGAEHTAAGKPYCAFHERIAVAPVSAALDDMNVLDDDEHPDWDGIW